VQWFALEALTGIAARENVRAAAIEITEAINRALRHKNEYVEQAAHDLISRLGRHGRERLLRRIYGEEAAFWAIFNWAVSTGEAATEELVAYIVGPNRELAAAAMLVVGKLARWAAPQLSGLLTADDGVSA
jgi:hypothetical protein